VPSYPRRPSSASASRWEQLKWFYRLSPENGQSPGQNLALTVLSVPNSLDSSHVARSGWLAVCVQRESSLMIDWEGHHESRRCSRDTYPESYITKYTSIRRLQDHHAHVLRPLAFCWGASRAWSSSLLLSSLELSDTKVYEPSIRARLGTAAHFCGMEFSHAPPVAVVQMTTQRGGGARCVQLVATFVFELTTFVFELTK